MQFPDGPGNPPPFVRGDGRGPGAVALKELRASPRLPPPPPSLPPTNGRMFFFCKKAFFFTSSATFVFLGGGFFFAEREKKVFAEKEKANQKLPGNGP